mmetsp:Transcript_36182/g.51175  ORF Transcript_36182/g.51175 Transcript_36182/m.51175 type:complete len:120 (+) Transcript_36182:276-635(+)
MYDSDKVTKGSFTLLLEYLQGLQGNAAKERILADATRRALRYNPRSSLVEQEESSNGTTTPNSKSMGPHHYAYNLTDFRQSSQFKHNRAKNQSQTKTRSGTLPRLGQHSCCVCSIYIES